MQKILTAVITIALTCTMGFAHETESASVRSENSRTISYKGICSGYVDADNDGLCDNCNSHHSSSNGACLGYVDADHDGFCDNHAYGEQCPYAPADTPDNSVTDTQSCRGRHHGNGGHHGNGHH